MRRQCSARPRRNKLDQAGLNCRPEQQAWTSGLIAGPELHHGFLRQQRLTVALTTGHNQRFAAKTTEAIACSAFSDPPKQEGAHPVMRTGLTGPRLTDLRVPCLMGALAKTGQVGDINDPNAIATRRR